MIRRERRHGGDREEKGLRKGVERKFEEEDKEHRHLPLLVVQLPQALHFSLNRFCSKGCSSEVLDSSISVKGLARKDYIRSEVVGVAKVANN